MLSQRWRPVFYAALAVLVIWAAAMVGYRLSKNARITVEKLKAYTEATDLSKLTGDERARALRRLAEMMNALSLEERRKVRFERLVGGWFEQMNEEEKASFIEATMPTGFKQMLTAFEQMPEEQRRKAVDDAMRRLREAQRQLQAGEGLPDGTNAPPPLSPELQGQIRTLGLKAFYSQSSAQTKAELAPVIEELQRVMETGRAFRHR